MLLSAIAEMHINIQHLCSPNVQMVVLLGITVLTFALKLC